MARSISGPWRFNFRLVPLILNKFCSIIFRNSASRSVDQSDFLSLSGNPLHIQRRPNGEIVEGREQKEIGALAAGQLVDHGKHIVHPLARVRHRQHPKLLEPVALDMPPLLPCLPIHVQLAQLAGAVERDRATGIEPRSTSGAKYASV